MLLINKVRGRKVHGGLLIFAVHCLHIPSHLLIFAVGETILLNQFPCRYSRMQGKGQATGAIPC